MKASIAAAVIICILVCLMSSTYGRRLETKKSERKYARRIAETLLELLEQSKEHGLTFSETAEKSNLDKRSSVFSSVTTSQFSTAVLDEHNRLRKHEAINETVSYMFKMAQDQNLVQFAQDHVDACVYEHTDNSERKDVYGYDYFGENMLYTTDGSVTVEEAVQLWYNEKDDYIFENRTCVPGTKCKHYTQVVWADSKYLGCALKLCSTLQTSSQSVSDAYFMVCEYGPGGNIIGNDPYVFGDATCEECPNNCIDNALCETSFNITVCEDAYTNCGQLDTDFGICQSSSQFYDPYATVHCPETCGLCTKKKRNFKSISSLRVK